VKGSGYDLLNPPPTPDEKEPFIAGEASQFATIDKETTKVTIAAT
jgi:hypothetical protein